LGKFRDLLGATAHHPAMLVYLDNVQNAAPGSKGPNGRTAGINENYARELMELHTLGVDGGYTQDDVVALARILTGWSLVRPNAMPEKGSGFRFYPARHDNIGAKYKSPYRFVLSAAHAAGAQVDNPKPLLGTMAGLGQPLYGCATPDGYRDTESAWLSPDASLLRVNFAKALAGGNLPIMESAQPVEAAPLLATFGTGLNGRTRAAVAQAQPELQAALILGSPDFMRR